MSKSTVLAVLGLAAGAAVGAPAAGVATAVGQAIPDGVTTVFTSDERPVALRIGGSEAAGFFKEATGFDSEFEVSERRR